MASVIGRSRRCDQIANPPRNIQFRHRDINMILISGILGHYVPHSGEAIPGIQSAGVSTFSNTRHQLDKAHEAPAYSYFLNSSFAELDLIITNEIAVSVPYSHERRRRTSCLDFYKITTS